MGLSIYRIDNRTYARYNGINSRKGDFGKVKKGMSVLTLFVMLLALAAPVLAEDVSGAGIWTEILAVGAWNPAVVESGGEMLAPAEFGLDFRMELLEDGACEIMRNGRSETGTWSQDGSSIAVQDDLHGEQLFALTEDGTLTAMVDEGVTVVFVRDGAATVTGLWTAASAASGGESFAPAEVEMELTMDLLEDGSCVLTLNGRNELGTWAQYGANVAVWDANGMAQRFELAEDGSLRAALGEFDVALVRDVAAKVAENIAGGEKGM